MMFGAPAGGSALPSRSALFRKFTPSMMTHCSVAGSPLSIFARSTTQACFSKYVVAGAGRHVVAIGPDGRARIIGKERTQELVAVVGAERVGRRADRVAHRIRTLFLRRTLASAARAARRPRPCAGVRRGRRRRHEEVAAAPGLPGMPGGLDVDRLPGRPDRRLVGPLGGAPEDRHDDQPAIGKLVVAHDRVAVVARLARSAESLEHRVVRHGSVQHLAGRVELLPSFREDRKPRVDRLHDVVGADGETVVRWVAAASMALRSLEPDAEAVEACDELCRRSCAWRRLFDGGACGIAWRKRGRADASLACGSGGEDDARTDGGKHDGTTAHVTMLISQSLFCCVVESSCRRAWRTNPCRRAAYLTLHSCKPAEAPGWSITSSLSADVVTGLNVTLFQASFATPNVSEVSTGFHWSPSL